MYQQDALRHIRIAALFVLGVLVLGTVGYMFIEHIPFIDALFITFNMMSTVGSVSYPFSASVRLFTVAIIILGVGSLFYTFGATMEFLIEGHLSQVIGRHRMDTKIAKLRNHSIICGFGRVGSRIAKEFATAR